MRQSKHAVKNNYYLIFKYDFILRAPFVKGEIDLGEKHQI